MTRIPNSKSPTYYSEEEKARQVKLIYEDRPAGWSIAAWCEANNIKASNVSKWHFGRGETLPAKPKTGTIHRPERMPLPKVYSW